MRGLWAGREPRSRPNSDIQLQNFRHIRSRHFARTAKPWGIRGAPRVGGIMDKVERSFAAATAAGFVVLVIGIVLLALM
ncbi:hypothetical protein GCM10010987_22630 [Bradyrhizobium guangdongense]|uniref:Uncharacterized protein n=1 Tax=Bradyrhizobium guangdongense TaxID=1325090 RepID=A0AA87W2F0_9BRAD|nr:hypothetical protein GCM10010987_22630 [Bradyrhizobium guangdongense]